MSLYSPGQKEALENPKKVYTNVLYEKKRPSPPRINRPINSKCAPKKGKKSHVSLSIFG